MAERRTHVPPAWYPLGAQRHYHARPEAGMVVALYRAAWRVTAVEVLPSDQWTPEDVDHIAEVDRRRPLLANAIRGRTFGYEPDKVRDNALPFRIELEHLGGVLPKSLAAAGETTGLMTFRAGAHRTWQVYPHGRWPKCSCCGEPMPCRAELADLRVDAAVERLEDFGSRMPGTCWACGEVTTRRQKTVRYVGENLDIPTGPEAVFHIRESCHYAATQYEARWLAADPSRRRIITYPVCPGRLVWHADGADQCVNGDPDCQGHLSHNHRSVASCRYMDGGCPRGCPPSQARIRTPRRPDYRDPDLPQGRPGQARHGADVTSLDEDQGDGREECPGTLIVHRDGTTGCKAGGRDDCWDDSKYHHRRRKSCRDQSCGCPTCETTEGLT